MKRDLVIKRILKKSNFYNEAELHNYPKQQLYTILKHCIFIALKDNLKKQEITNTHKLAVLKNTLKRS